MEPTLDNKGIDRCGLSDSGNLLVMFASAAKTNVDIEERDVDSYAFLISAHGIIRFHYPFRFEPFPYSSDLRDDLYALIDSGYLHAKSPIRISRGGKVWVEQISSASEELKTNIDKATSLLRSMSGWSRKQLFDAIYHEITR